MTMKKARHSSASAFQRRGSGCAFTGLLPAALVDGLRMRRSGRDAKLIGPGQRPSRRPGLLGKDPVRKVEALEEVRPEEGRDLVDALALQRQHVDRVRQVE